MQVEFAPGSFHKMEGLNKLQAEEHITAGLGGESRGIVSVLVGTDAYGKVQWRDRASIVVADASKDTPIANRFLKSLKDKSGTGAILRGAGSKIQKLCAANTKDIQQESSDRSRWDANRMEIEEDSSSAEDIEFALDQLLFKEKRGGVFLPAVDVDGNDIVLTRTNTQEPTPLSKLPYLDAGDGGGASAMSDIRTALSTIPGLAAAPLYEALQNLSGAYINIYEDNMAGSKVLKILHRLHDPSRPQSD
jgi:hypothetical protein